MLITSTLPNGTKISIELEDKYLVDIVIALWKDSDDSETNGRIQAIGGILGLSTLDTESKQIKRLY